jgi:hypothetical protein
MVCVSQPTLDGTAETSTPQTLGCGTTKVCFLFLLRVQAVPTGAPLGTQTEGTASTLDGVHHAQGQKQCHGWGGIRN